MTQNKNQNIYIYIYIYLDGYIYKNMVTQFVWLHTV